MNCPIWLDKIISQMLQPQSRKRPYSAQAIVMAFDEIKKIDVHHKAAVDQITEGFNALNAGADKSEARKLLGKRQQKEMVEIASIFQSVPFLVTSLIAMIAFIVWIAMPPSTEKVMLEARSCFSQNEAVTGLMRGEMLKPIMEGDSPFTDEAETMYYELRQKP